MVTEFTLFAEKKTEALTGIPINSKITEMTRQLECSHIRHENRSLFQSVMRIDERAFRLLNEFIHFKECILGKVNNGQLFTASYPFLIQHIIRETKLYREIVEQLLGNRDICYQSLYETAHNFSKDYAKLLEMACRQDSRANNMSERILRETLKYRDFKAAGT